MAGVQVSDYERQRQEKIAANQQLLRQLQLDAAQTGLGPKSKPKPTSSSTSTKRKRAPAAAKIKEEDNAPRRTSARLQGIVADSEVARQKDEADNSAFHEQQKAKRQRFSDDIALSDAVVNGRTWNQAGNFLTAVGPAQPGARTFDPRGDDAESTAPTTTTAKELREARERMSNLKLWAGAEMNRIKITPERIYSMAFHPTPDKALVFAGDKLGNLGLFDASQTSPAQIKQEADDADEDGDGDGEVDDEVEPAITTFKLHARTIAALHCPVHAPHTLLTASYDSSIRRLDLNKGAAVQIYAPADSNTDAPISGVELSSADPNRLYFTTLNGEMGMQDLRAPASEADVLQLSEKKIGGFSLHPAHPHLMATAGLDRAMRVWDLRKITGKGDARSPLCLGEHISSLSVSHAAFNSAGQIATSSYDDTIKIHSVDPNNLTKDLDMEPTTVIPHNNQTGRWVTILRPSWQPPSQAPHPPGDGIQKFVIGNMNRFVDIYASSGEQLAQLGGEGVTAVPAVAVIHPNGGWVAGGTASGKLGLWM
ncbi:hypothetical protein LTR53_007690 [Teratosphaeriaceae sp. CCFEE 6253]|nr:hypothetical protein LTR53_007690 [Teratosphaeriaceae sp. CCFEE 6253]